MRLRFCVLALMAAGCQCLPLSFVGLPCDPMHPCPGALRCERHACVDTSGGGDAVGGGGSAVGGGGGDADGGGGSTPGSSKCDLTGDGGCDCLRIATLGFPGYLGDSDLFADWIGKASQRGVSSLGSTVLTADVLAAYEVIVVHDVGYGAPGESGIGVGIGRRFSTAEQDAMREWVKNGGGLIVLNGYATASELSNINFLLSPFGLRYSSTAAISGSLVTNWEDHPLTQGIRRIWFASGYPVTGATLVARESLAGDDVARASEFGQGRVFVWGDDWISYTESLSRSDCQVARFWLNMLSWATPLSRCQVVLPP